MSSVLSDARSECKPNVRSPLAKQQLFQ